jgi:hypothetical protein
MVVLVIIEIWAMESINTESGKLSSKADTFLITGMFKYDNIQLNEDEQNMDYEQFEKSENFWDKPRDNLTEENIWYRQVWDWAQEQVRKIDKKFDTVIIISSMLGIRVISINTSFFSVFKI